MNDNLKISIIIIGYNTAVELIELLSSLNALKGASNVVEVIYIDDGSQDSSFSIFQNFNLKFLKVGKKLDKNYGRSFATQKGINVARGLWCLFVRSNESVSSDLILEFKKAILSNAAPAYMGVVKYRSKDKKFEKYLNNLTFI